MCDSTNIKIVSNILGCCNTKDFRSEYEEVVRPHLEVWVDGKPCTLTLRWLDNEQRGGINYKLETNRESFDIEVSYLEGITYGDDGHDRSYKIIFFNPQFRQDYDKNRDYFKKYCVMLKVHPEERYVELSDLNNYNPCFETKESKFGKIMVRGVIFYCQKYRHHLGVDYIELGDNSQHWCTENKYCRINLGYSRQLLGGYPYYWQFGFRPEKVVVDRINNNIDRINSLPIDFKISSEETIVEYLCNDLENEEICDIVQKEASNHKMLVTFLRWFSTNYCCEWSYVYMGLFGALRLTSIYRGVSGEWKLFL